MATIAPTQPPLSEQPRWTVQDAESLYRVAGWGNGYFGINELGHVTVLPGKDPERAIDLHELVSGLDERGICPPVLLRFDDILSHRMRELRRAFDAAIDKCEYAGKYQCVYPIKANQQRHICELIRDKGLELGFGLEAGSKPELLAVLALTAGHDAMPIVCNGFKDDEFIETVVLATKLGRNIIPIIEKFSELELIVKYAKKYEVRPQIGMRIKLSARGAGRWEKSAGVRSKFGLFVSEALRAVDRLTEEGMAGCLKLVHCHVGSQVHDIREVKNAINELAFIYTELRRLGAGLTTIDIGGGLGIDYDGTQSSHESSINYTIQEYADDVVYRIKNACDDAGAPHPNIISESGRAMVSYGSVLVFNVVGMSHFPSTPDLPWIRKLMDNEQEVPQPVIDLLDAFERLDGSANLLEIYHDAIQARDEAMSLFNLGYMSLPMRAAIERLFWATGRRLIQRMDPEEMPGDLRDLPDLLSDIYFCNFSMFQSIPDSWAIDQLFPICPVHRLNERPTRRAVLADITCDSDGQVDHFVDGDRTLAVHALDVDQPYYLAAFLVGAYQETLGDLHNLFGDTHAVHVSIGPDGRWQIDEVIEGDTVKDVLSYVQFDPRAMRRIVRNDVEHAVQAGQLSVAEGRSLRAFYEDGLDGYTYLEE